MSHLPLSKGAHKQGILETEHPKNRSKAGISTADRRFCGSLYNPLRVYSWLKSIFGSDRNGDEIRHDIHDCVTIFLSELDFH